MREKNKDSLSQYLPMRLSKIRLTRGKDASAVAKYLGFSSSSNYLKYENTKAIRTPGLDVLAKLAEYYGITLDELTGYVPNIDYFKESMQILENYGVLYEVQGQYICILMDIPYYYLPVPRVACVKLVKETDAALTNKEKNALTFRKMLFEIMRKGGLNPQLKAKKGYVFFDDIDCVVY